MVTTSGYILSLMMMAGQGSDVSCGVVMGPISVVDVNYELDLIVKSS